MIFITNKVGLFLESELFRSVLMLRFFLAAIVGFSQPQHTLVSLLVPLDAWSGVANLVAVRALFVG